MSFPCKATLRWMAFLSIKTTVEAVEPLYSRRPCDKYKCPDYRVSSIEGFHCTHLNYIAKKKQSITSDYQIAIQYIYIHCRCQ